jgi:hypothetical protein
MELRNVCTCTGSGRKRVERIQKQSTGAALPVLDQSLMRCIGQRVLDRPSVHPFRGLFLVLTQNLFWRSFATVFLFKNIRIPSALILFWWVPTWAPHFLELWINQICVLVAGNIWGMHWGMHFQVPWARAGIIMKVLCVLNVYSCLVVLCLPLLCQVIEATSWVLWNLTFQIYGRCLGWWPFCQHPKVEVLYDHLCCVRLTCNEVRLSRVLPIYWSTSELPPFHCLERSPPWFWRLLKALYVDTLVNLWFGICHPDSPDCNHKFPTCHRNCLGMTFCLQMVSMLFYIPHSEFKHRAC